MPKFFPVALNFGGCVADTKTRIVIPVSAPNSSPFEKCAQNNIKENICDRVRVRDYRAPGNSCELFFTRVEIFGALHLNFGEERYLQFDGHDKQWWYFRLLFFHHGDESGSFFQMSSRIDLSPPA